MAEIWERRPEDLTASIAGLGRGRILADVPLGIGPATEPPRIFRPDRP